MYDFHIHNYTVFLYLLIPVQQSSFYGYAGMLPRRFTQAVMTGESKYYNHIMMHNLVTILRKRVYRVVVQTNRQ